MPTSRSTRRARHEQSSAPRTRRGLPNPNSGSVGDQAFTQGDSGSLVHLVKGDTGWKKMGESSSDVRDAVTIVGGATGGGGSGGGGGVGASHPAPTGEVPINVGGSGVISIDEYDPIGAAASGVGNKGIITTSGATYDGNSPGTFVTHFLRKDGSWADVSASLNAFVTWSWVPQSGTPFTTVADSSADSITITAGSGLEFADTSSGSTDALTLSSTIPNLTVSGAGTVHANNYTDSNTTYSVGDGGLTQNNFTNTLKSKLDGIESSADVTDTTNVTAAGALMDSELSGIAAVKATTGTFLSADESKLDGIEASADVTDSTNVNAAGAIMHTDIPDSDTGFVVRSGSAQYDIDGTDYIQTGANTLSDSSGYAGIYHSSDAAELKFYTLKAGDNITLAKNNAGGQANTYLEISATDAPTANRFTGILDDGVTTYTAAGATDTLKIAGGTGVNTSAGQSGSTVTVTLTMDIGTGGSQAAAGNHTHNYIATSHAANSITSSHITVLGNTSGTNSGDQTLPTRDSLGVDTDDAVTFATVNTGQGANELYDMNQNVLTSSDVRFDSFGVGTNASSTTGEIRATNEVTAYYSDDRLKNKYGNIEGALKKVCSLNGFHYQANELAGTFGYDTSKKQVGVSAQECLKVMPEVVASAPIDAEYYTVHYEKLVPLLIEAIKELSERKCNCGSKHNGKS